MCVLNIIGSINRSGGGPSRSSQGLVAGLRAAGVDAWLMTLSHGEEPWIKGCDQFINGGELEEALVKVKPDIVHLHGIWDLELHRCAMICRRWKIPYVIAPRGMLEPWSLKQKWLKKRIARFLYQDRDLKKSAALHATAESEAEQFRKLGFKNYIVVSPNGVNVPVDAAPSPRQKIGVENRCTAELFDSGKAASMRPPRGDESGALGDSALHETDNSTVHLFSPPIFSPHPHRALFVSRMHPKKGVLELVESWARVFGKSDTGLVGADPRAARTCTEKWVCEFVYTLNGDTEREYETNVKQRVKELSLDDQFIFTGPLNDDDKWSAYARADLFILPTYSENFGIVVAEALWAGLPVITTKGTPWSELVSHHCGWWINLPGGEKKVGVENRCTAEWTALDNALLEATSTSNLNLLGQRGHALIQEKYTWKAVVKAMVHGYEQILNPCEFAPCDSCRNYGDTCPIK